MNRCKKITALLYVLLTILNIVACGQVKENEVINTDESATSQQESNVQTVESTDSEIKEDETVHAEESNTQAEENIESEMSTEELLNLFINGSINAIDSTDLTSTFYITDLNMDSEEGGFLFYRRES